MRSQVHIMGRNCDVTRTARREPFDNSHVAVTHIRVIAVQSVPFTFNDSHPQPEIYDGIGVSHASAPTAWQRVSDVRVGLTSLIDQPQRPVNGIGAHCVEVNKSFSMPSFFDYGLQKFGVKTK